MAYYGGREMAAAFRTVRGNTITIAEEIPAEDVLRTMAVSIAVDEAVRRSTVVRVQEFEASR